MKIFNHDIDVIIFDLDGTLLDSTSLWKDIDKNFFARRNMEVPSDYAKQIVHLGLEETAYFTKKTYGIKETPEEILQEWRNDSIEAYSKYLNLKPGAKEFLERLFKNNVKLAIATANDKELYDPCLKRLGIDKYFSLILDTKTVKEGKQSPKLYKAIADAFKIDENRIMVFEDICVGLKTAYVNGFITVGIDDINSKDDEINKRKYSHYYIKDFLEI